MIVMLRQFIFRNALYILFTYLIILSDKTLEYLKAEVVKGRERKGAGGGGDEGRGAAAAITSILLY